MQATSEGRESRHVCTLAQCAWTEITLALNAGLFRERENEIKKNKNTGSKKQSSGPQ